MPSKTPKPLPIATITNNLGYDVDIYDVFDPKTNTASTQGLTKYTFLATVPDGASAQQVQTIHRTSALQAMRTGEITALNNNYYQQFPVAVLGVLPKSLGGPTDFTLTSDMQQGMEQSFEFIKYSQANPTSQLATDFRTAVGDQTNQTTAVNTFFQGTGSFQQCTLDTWTAVVGWQAQFTNPWQGKYYLYSTGSNSTGSTTGTADSTGTTGTTGSSSSGPTLVASLLITSSAAANTAVLTMADTGGQSTSVVMVGDGSMQEENPGTGPLSVSLTPVWLNVTQSSQVNGKTVSSYVIGAAFTGTINGISVTGNLNKLALPSPSDSSSSASDKKLSFMKILSAIEGVAGLLITAGMLFYQIKSHKLAEKEKEHEALKDATSPADAKEKVAAVKADYQENEVPLQRAAAQKVDVAVQAVPEAYEQRDQAEKLEVQVDVVDKEVEKIGDDLRQSLGEGAANPEEEKITGELTNAKKNIKKELNGSESAAEDKAAAEKVKTDLNKASTNVDQTLKNEGNTLSQNEQKDLTSARDALNGEQDEANGLKQEQQEQNKENAEKASDKVDGDDLGNAKREDEGGDFKAPKIAE